jgi:hypothetical protein
MFTNDGYALLIGIDDYSAFDRSTDQKPGTSDLKGSRNDVHTFWRLCRLLGMKPANIRVLASPPIDACDLEGASPEQVGVATAAEITAGVAWLAERLGHTSRPTGLMTYSGHGDWLASEGLVLCPSDVVAGNGHGADVSLDNAVAFSALNAVLGKHNAAENLTVVLDTCHSGGEAAVPRARAALETGHALSLTARPVATIARLVRKHAQAPERLSGRVLSAAGREQVAYQSMFDGEYHGLFSWAIAAAVEQWMRRQEDGNVFVDVSYSKLLETAQRLITALWFEQTPELHGPVGVGALAAFQRGLVPQSQFIRARPDGGFMKEQIDPSYDIWRKITMTFASGTPLATIYVFNWPLGSYVIGTEYWYVNTGALSLLGREGLNMVATNEPNFNTPSPPGYTNQQSIQLPENVSWGTGWTVDPVSGGSLYAAGAGGIYLRLTRNPLNPALLNRITWYQVLTTGATPSNITPTGAYSIAGASVPVTAGHSGYDISQSF